MQQITLSGWATVDSEDYVDSIGKKYKRFIVRCMSYDRMSRKIYTDYTCYTYLTQLDDIKKGDDVVLTGKQTLGVTQDEKGNPKVLASVVIHQITVKHRDKKDPDSLKAPS